MEKQDQDKTAPQSPEGYPKAVREQLDQRGQTHEGNPRPATPAQPGSKERGATEDEVTPIKPPMRGPSDLIGASGDDDTDEEIDPRDELTPG